MKPVFKLNYPASSCVTAQVSARGFESKFMFFGLKSNIKVPSKNNKKQFLSIRWHLRSLSQAPFYFGRGFTEDLELPKKLFRDVQISHFRNKHAKITLKTTNTLNKFCSITQAFKLSHFLTNSYILGSHFSNLTYFSNNLRSATVSALSRRKRYFSSTYRGAHSNALRVKHGSRFLIRKLFRLRTSVWLNHLMGWSTLLPHYSGFGLKSNSELRAEGSVQDTIKTERFLNHLESHPSRLVRQWSPSPAGLLSPVLTSGGTRIRFMFAAMRLRVLRGHAIYFRQLELKKVFTDLTWFKWERLQTIRRTAPSASLVTRFSIQNMMLTLRRFRLKLRRHKSFKFRRVNHFRKTLLIRKYWRMVWLIKRRFQLKNFIVNKFAKYCSFKLQRFTNIYVLRTDLLLCKIFRVTSLRFARRLILKNHVRINGKVVWNFAETVRRFDVLTISRRAKEWIKLLQRLRLKRARGVRSLSRNRVRPYLRNFIKTRRVSQKKRTLSGAFISNPFGAVLCSPRRAKLKKCLSKAYSRIYKHQCTYLYRTIFQ